MFEGEGEKPKFHFSETARRVFLKFKTRSDDPGEFLSSEEKDKLQEATRTNPEALKKWEEDRNSKYRINSLYSPLLASESFLQSIEAESIPSDLKKELKERVEVAYKNLNDTRGKRITKELVDEVEGIVNEITKYLK